LGLVGQPYPRILSVAPQLDPSFLPQAAGFSWAEGPNAILKICISIWNSPDLILKKIQNAFFKK